MTLSGRIGWVGKGRTDLKLRGELLGKTTNQEIR